MSITKRILIAFNGALVFFGVLVVMVVVFFGDTDTESTTTAAQPTAVDAVDQIYHLGSAVVRAGIAVEYDVSGWNRALDLSISSMLPGDAREIAESTCVIARENGLAPGWTVRVFLPVGDRPAATCTL